MVAKSGNGTVLSAQTTVTSADRRTVTVTTDTDGTDTAVDRKTVSVLGSDGSSTVTEEQFTPGAALTARTVTVTSANGLVRTITEDINGDASTDRILSETTTFETDGSVQIDALVRNGDQSLRGATRTVTSDDGLTVTVFADRDGDIDGNGVADFDHRQQTGTLLGTDGSRTTTVEEWTYSDANPTGTRLSRAQTVVSDDGLMTIEKFDADGDMDFDLTCTARFPRRQTARG